VIARKPVVASISACMLACCGLVLGGCGSGSATPPPTPPTTPVSPGPASGSEFIYSFSFGNDIQVATLDKVSGAISSVTDAAPNLYPALIADFGRAFTVLVRGKYFYVTGFDQPDGSYAIFGFTITGAHGELTSLPSSPYINNNVISYATGLVADGQGKNLYISGMNTILIFQIDQNTGILTNTGMKLTGGNEGLKVCGADSTGKYIYALGQDGGSIDIHILAIGFAGGLSEIPGSPFPAYSTTSDLISTSKLLISPSGNYLYLLITGINGVGQPVTSFTNVYSFSINALTGALTPIPGSPFILRHSDPVASQGDSSVSPNGKFLYVPNRQQMTADNSMSVYAIDTAHGTVGLDPAFTVAAVAGTGVFGNTNLIDPSGSVLISKGAGATAWTYLINGSTGALSATPGSPFNFYNGQTGVPTIDYRGSSILEVP